MHPRTFLEEIAHPNMVAALEEPDDMRAIVNAILTLDALAGIIYAHQRSVSAPAFAAFKRDDEYRDHLSTVSAEFRALRDTAASLKHGELSHGKKARLVRRPDQVQSVNNELGSFELGDRLGHDVVVIELVSGVPAERADFIIGETYQVLKPIVDALS